MIENKQLKVNFQMCPEEIKHILGVLEDKDDWKDLCEQEFKVNFQMCPEKRKKM